jgi:hypothetical protein
LEECRIVAYEADVQSVVCEPVAVYERVDVSEWAVVDDVELHFRALFLGR